MKHLRSILAGILLALWCLTSVPIVFAQQGTPRMAAPVLLPDGAADCSSLGLFFANDTNTGMVRTAADTIGFCAGGALRASLSTTAWTQPLLVGGTGTTSTLTLRSTSGVGAAGADIIFQVGNNGATEAERITNAGNFIFGAGSAGTNAVNVHVFGASTAPTTSPADVVQLWAADIAGAGTFGLNIRDEGGNLFKFGNGQILTPDGTVSLPSVAFGSETGTGLFRNTGGSIISFSINGFVNFEIRNGNIDINTGNLRFLSNTAEIRIGASSDVVLLREAAQVLAQRNGVNAQTFRGYGTFTDASNYERWALSATGGTGITLAAETAGTGGDNLSLTLTPAGTGNVTTAIGAGGIFQVGSTLRFAVTDGAAGTGTRLRTAQATAPTCTTNCGTTPSVAGSDTAMVVTLGTGTPASPVTVTFNGTWATAPACTAANRTTAANSISRVDSTTTTAVVYFLAGPTASDLVALTCLGVS